MLPCWIHALLLRISRILWVACLWLRHAIALLKADGRRRMLLPLVCDRCSLSRVASSRVHCSSRWSNALNATYTWISSGYIKVKYQYSIVIVNLRDILTCFFCCFRKRFCSFFHLFLSSSPEELELLELLLLLLLDLLRCLSFLCLPIVYTRSDRSN